MENISTSYDNVLWALCVWREARGELYRAKLAVAHVIHNRLRSPRWPDTPSDVVLQPLQFSSFNRDDPNAVKWPSSRDAAWHDSCQAVHDVLAGIADPTAGANHYHSLQPERVKWADPAKETAIIGHFRFYKL